MPHRLLSVLLMLASTAAVVVLSAKCPEDPLACILLQSVDTDKNQEAKAEQASHLFEDLSRAAIASSNAAESNSEAIVSAQSNETFCVGNATGDARCRKCTSCPKHALVLRACSAKHDALCVCRQGHYWSALTSQRNFECKPCKACAAGTGILRPCTRNRNTVCQRCPVGTFSTGDGNCVICSSCRNDQLLLQECSSLQDTVCIGKLRRVYRERVFSAAADVPLRSHRAFSARHSRGGERMCLCVIFLVQVEARAAACSLTRTPGTLSLLTFFART